MRLLLVDSDKCLTEVVRRGLAASGYATDAAHDGPRALLKARTVPYDALILDVLLPGLNGYRLCRKLRGAGVNTPILILTAKDGEHDVIEGLDSGADDYLTKPFSFPVLRARIRALLRRRPVAAPALRRHGDLTIDPAKRRCRRGNADIPLTAKEFAVLEYLSSKAGQVVSKAEILEHVWDFAYDGDVNIVAVYICNLRRKVDAPFGRSAIVTLRGAGYLLSADGG
ncbi:MAG: response regulator transcription factor [Stackebrandtia sp.]